MAATVGAVSAAVGDGGAGSELVVGALVDDDVTALLGVAGGVRLAAGSSRARGAAVAAPPAPPRRAAADAAGGVLRGAARLGAPLSVGCPRTSLPGAPLSVGCPRTSLPGAPVRGDSESPGEGRDGPASTGELDAVVSCADARPPRPRGCRCCCCAGGVGVSGELFPCDGCSCTVLVLVLSAGDAATVVAALTALTACGAAPLRDSGSLLPLPLLLLLARPVPTLAQTAAAASRRGADDGDAEADGGSVLLPLVKTGDVGGAPFCAFSRGASGARSSPAAVDVNLPPGCTCCECGAGLEAAAATEVLSISVRAGLDGTPLLPPLSPPLAVALARPLLPRPPVTWLMPLPRPSSRVGPPRGGRGADVTARARSSTNLATADSGAAAAAAVAAAGTASAAPIECVAARGRTRPAAAAANDASWAVTNARYVASVSIVPSRGSRAPSGRGNRKQNGSSATRAWSRPSEPVTRC